MPGHDYYIDRHEVTNAEFKAFIDAGGYEKREVLDGAVRARRETLDWARPWHSFATDGTAGAVHLARRHVCCRPGSVSGRGVSWFEAVAYAAFRGKHLPTIYHWTYAARPELGDSVTRVSHFGGAGPVRVGAAPGLGPYGTVDMAGNVKEWVWNEHAGTGKRYILGGAWNDPDYQFLYSDSRSPFDRSDTNGFRCMAYGDGPAPPAALTTPISPPVRDYAAERPVADAAYRIYADQYSYDRTPFDVRVESTDDPSPHWRHEVVSIAAVYGGERMPVHLFLPKNAKPPYQTVLFFPGSLAIAHRHAFQLDTRHGLHHHERPGAGVSGVQVHLRADGRAVIVVAGAQTRPTRPGCTRSWAMRGGRSTMSKRARISTPRGWPTTASPGALSSRRSSLALESRFKAALLLMGGLGGGKPSPEVDPFNFAPRVKFPSSW